LVNEGLLRFRQALLVLMILVLPMHPNAAANPLLIDDFSRADERSMLGTPWRLVTDQVMGGLSRGQMRRGESQGRRALCLSGAVSLANNGGFLQVNLALGPNGSQDGTLDASRYFGVRLVASGNGEGYKVHLKTLDTVFPWQSYRADFRAEADWREIRLPFDVFMPHRLDIPLATSRLTRLGVVAIGRAMAAEVCLAEIGLY
jgi:hypothetical protein